MGILKTLHLTGRKTRIAVVLLTGVLIISGYLISVKSQYKYNVADDYSYASNGEGRDGKGVLAVAIVNGKFSLRSGMLKNCSAFIPVRVESNLMAEFFSPSILIQSSGIQYRYYFEYGGSGTRYINLNKLLDSGTDSILTVQLTGDFSSIPDQETRVVTFEKPDIEKKTILVIAPHPDDAELAAYAFYKNRNSYIVTITSGEGGYNTYDELALSMERQYQLKGKFRFWNSISLPMLGGVPMEHSVNLAYFDTELEDMYNGAGENIPNKYTGIHSTLFFRAANVSSLVPPTDGMCNWPNLLNDLRSLIKTIQPDIIVTPHPQVDDHPDHRYATLAVLQSIQLERYTKGHLFLYSNHSPFGKGYPSGPAGTELPLPPRTEPGFVYESIYSHSVSTDDQQEKILILESFNDLRLDTEWTTLPGYLYTGFRLLINTLTFNRLYYEKAIRSNELFFVLPCNDADRLIETFQNK